MVKYALSTLDRNKYLMSQFSFNIYRQRLDKHYIPAENTRLTTNFANLARGDNREQNLHNALTMLNRRFNTLADWDNPSGKRYSVELDIISVAMALADVGQGDTGGIDLPIIEMLETTIVDNHTQRRYNGIVGNNFSSYVRDYDFSVRLLEHNKNRAEFSVPDDFGDLHAKLYQSFVNSTTYREQFAKPPVICLSVSTTKTYHRTANIHPILGVEYRQDDYSLTDIYFGKMGLQVRYFMPAHSVAPLAFYFTGDLLNDYSNLELISTISTMETFQKIYRPEIYNANSPAGVVYQPSLSQQDYSLTCIMYDREERSRLAVEQGRYAEEYFLKPYQSVLEDWAKTVDFA